MAFLSCNGVLELLPNGSRLSCGRLARRRKSSGRWSVPGHDATASFRTRAPASFKALVRRPLLQQKVQQGAVELGRALQVHHVARPVNHDHP